MIFKFLAWLANWPPIPRLHCIRLSFYFEEKNRFRPDVKKWIGKLGKAVMTGEKPRAKVGSSEDIERGRGMD